MERLAQKTDCIQNVRIKGTAAAIEFDCQQTGKQVCDQMKEKKFIFGNIMNQMMVLKPPLSLTEEQTGQFLNALEECLMQVTKSE